MDFRSKKDRLRTYEQQLRADTYRLIGGVAIFAADAGYEFTEGYHGPIGKTIEYAGFAISAVMYLGPSGRWLHGYDRLRYPTEADLDFYNKVERPKGDGPRLRLVE